MLYYLLTGQYPFPDGTAVEKMMAHQHKQPKPIRESHGHRTPTNAMPSPIMIKARAMDSYFALRSSPTPLFTNRSV